MEILQKYFPGLTAEQTTRFAQLKELYQFWNARINVISRQDIEHLYERHILHSLSIALIFSFKPGTTILDVGTGGGLPGIPLAILFPEVSFTLSDSIGKKIKVVQEISASLKLQNVTAINQRAEKIKSQFNFVTGRAVTGFPEFYNLVFRRISNQQKNNFKNGILYLKGGNFTEELTLFPQAKVYQLNIILEEPFFETKKLIYCPLS